MSSLDTLKVNTDTLFEVVSALGIIKSGLDLTSNITGKASKEVGHDGLEQALKKFNTKWDSRRNKISESVAEVKEGTEMTAIGLKEWDESLADALAEDN